jgi:hypothetical protein
MFSRHVFCGPNWWSIFGFIDAVVVDSSKSFLADLAAEAGSRMRRF